MAYGTKYRLEWSTPTADCRLRLQKDGYSSGVTDLEPAEKPFSLEWKRTDANEDLTIPLKISTGTIRFTGDSVGQQVSEVFDSGDTEWRVLFDRDTGGGHQLEWQGYVADNLWGDNPHVDHETVELPVLDGLALLEDRDFDSGSSNDLYTTVRNILQGLHSLDVAANMQWYPYRDGNQLSASQLPLGELTTAKNAFDELEPIKGRSSFRTKDERDERRVLEAVLERFGMELFQQRGEWVVRQRSQIQSDGTIKMWPDQSAVTNDNPSTRDLNRSLGALTPREKPRGLVERLRKTESVQKYGSLNELVKNGSFESAFSRWEKTEPARTTVARKTYSNAGLPAQGTQKDDHLLLLERGSATTGDFPVLEQTLPAILHDAGPDGAYLIQWDLAFSEELIDPMLRVEVQREGKDNAYVQHRTTTVQANAKPAEEGSVFVNPLPGDSDTIVLPEGSVLPIRDRGVYRAEIELTQPAYGGAEELVGNVSKNVKSGDDLSFWVWTIGVTEQDGQNNTINPRLDTNLQFPNTEDCVEKLKTQKLFLPQRAPDGTRVVGDLRLEYSNLDVDTKIWIDHVSVQLVTDGNPISSTSYTALDKQSGRSIEIEQLLGDGPTFDHPRALQLSGVEVTRDWQVGAYASGASRSGQLIEEVSAEAAMRMQRDTLQRRTHDVDLRNEEVWPEDVFTIDSDLYTVSRLKRTFGVNGDIADVELTRLKDAGTSGLERTFDMESQDGGGGGFGGGISGSGGGGVSGSGVEVLQLDASGGNTTEKLPAVTSGKTILAVRVDTSSNTGTLEVDDTNNESIVWPGRKTATSFDLYGHQSLLLSSDGTDWYVENPASYEIEAVRPGKFAPDSVVFRHVARHALRLVDVRIDARTVPGQMDFLLKVFDASDTQQYSQTISVSSKQSTTAIGHTMQENHVVRIKTDARTGNFDPDMADTSINIDAYRG